MTDNAGKASLVEAHQAEVWKYLRFLGCDVALAEDLTQETFLVLLRRPFAEVSRMATSAYLRTVARNLFLQDRRRPGSTMKPSDLDAAEALWLQHYDPDGGHAYLEALRGCIELLDERSRLALDLRFRDGASREAAARSLGLSEEGVKSVLRRAKLCLKHCIEGKLRHE
ncbi:MAG TPA: RNA polymerase sigma factor [Planctomycetota bacterium]|nr:RNA polymerase sigma factor [Planctomycetota bacterium]